MAGGLVTWPKLFLLGDSQTQLGFSDSGCWLSIVANHFQRRCDVLSRGFSGYNTRWLKLMLPRLIDAELAKTCAAITLFIGSNDAVALPESPQGVPLPEYKQTVKDIVQYLLDLNVSREKIILISPPPVDADLWSVSLTKKGVPPKHGLSNERTCTYAAALCDVAQELGVGSIDLYTEMMKSEEWRKYVSFDGLHLAKEGSQLLSELVIRKLEKITSDCEVIFPDWKELDYENLSSNFS
ncbi:isoamyl acetate-hydrolyzing esterase 1 homolog [Watersipora subatra]|uniref:isoamyl acetate-hydrolyzing esterase 1 homolog n=1 Tax=Watersipora subatra TaxID=2589382 RepID=UPI00355C5FFF